MQLASSEARKTKDSRLFPGLSGPLEKGFPAEGFDLLLLGHGRKNWRCPDKARSNAIDANSML